MAAADKSFTGWLKREDCKRTKHDSAFSDWKVCHSICALLSQIQLIWKEGVSNLRGKHSSSVILVGPNDWEDYLLGKEGTERYRTQNLPNCISCSGVYELGVAVSRRKTEREASRLGADYIVPVYVGKSDNVRTRLQQYGRVGALLENDCSNSELCVDENISGPKRAGLFTETFSRGFSIVYRWAPMNDNKDAERTEAQLPDKFDYAWNKGSNGVRRHNDVLRKLDDISRETRFPAFIRKLQLSLGKRKGVRIKACEPLLLENGSDFHDSFKSTNFLPQILKFGRSQPRIVSLNFGVNGDPNIICGVALGHGSVCIRPPITGNKRCAEHKGMKVNSVKSKLIAEGNESTRPCVSIGEGNAPICGFILDSGVPCARIPFQRNKRCMEHKGRRNQVSISQPMTDKIGQWTHNPILENRTSSSNDCQHILSSRAGTQDSPDLCSSLIHQNYNVICGVHLNDGSFCTRQPAVGRKRCEGHKGMRVKESISKQLGVEIPSLFAGPVAKIRSGKKHLNIDIPSVNYSPTCGATLRNGSFCRRKPSEGNKRCWQHKGRKN